MNITDTESKFESDARKEIYKARDEYHYVAANMVLESMRRIGLEVKDWNAAREKFVDLLEENLQ